MANRKGKSVKKKNKPIQLIAIILILGLVLYLAFGDLLVNTENKSDGNVMRSYTAIDFKKNGELTFTNDSDEYISKIDIEIAEDDNSRTKGMMYRDKMEFDQGMFFLFPTESTQSFWMRNTMISLDIIFVNAKNEIVTIHKNAIPFDEGHYRSTKPAKFVVEVNAEYTDSLNIKEGDKINWRRTK